MFVFKALNNKPIIFRILVRPWQGPWPCRLAWVAPPPMYARLVKTCKSMVSHEGEVGDDNDIGVYISR